MTNPSDSLSRDHQPHRGDQTQRWPDVEDEKEAE
jgi:hypothetical protein